jgi:hypothetical protein
MRFKVDPKTCCIETDSVEDAVVIQRVMVILRRVENVTEVKARAMRASAAALADRLIGARCGK